MTGEESAGRKGLLKVGLNDRPSLRWAAVDITGPTRVACKRLDLSPVAAGAIGRCLAGAALLQRMVLKVPNRLVLAVSGDGPLRRAVGEVDDAGSLRGMVAVPQIELPVADPGELGVSRSIGNGVLQVWRELARATYQSQVELLGGRIGEALAGYLHQSEQTRSAVLLGVLARADGIAAAGGMILEALPGAPAAEVESLERRISELAGVSRILADQGLDGLIEAVLASADRRITETRELEYRCRCSRESIGRYLATVGRDERHALRRENGSIEAECVFCGERYRFDESALEA